MFAKRVLRFISIVKEAPGSFTGAIIDPPIWDKLEKSFT